MTEDPINTAPTGEVTPLRPRQSSPTVSFDASHAANPSSRVWDQRMLRTQGQTLPPRTPSFRTPPFFHRSRAAGQQRLADPQVLLSRSLAADRDLVLSREHVVTTFASFKSLGVFKTFQRSREVAKKSSRLSVTYVTCLWCVRRGDSESRRALRSKFTKGRASIEGEGYEPRSTVSAYVGSSTNLKDLKVASSLHWRLQGGGAERDPKA